MDVIVHGVRSRAAAHKAAFSEIVGTRPSGRDRERQRRALCLDTTDGEGTSRDLGLATGESVPAVPNPKPGGGGIAGTIAGDPMARACGVPGERE